MKIVSEKKITDKKLNDIIIKNITLRADFFKRHNKTNKHQQCIVCKQQNLAVIGSQFRNFFFYDKDIEPPFTKRYYTDAKYCLNNERLLYCDHCGLAFAELAYPYEFYLDIMTHMDDQSDPINYDENLLQVDKEWALDKHLARMNFFGTYQNSNIQNPKLLEISSYRGWGLNYSKNDFDVYGIEPHKNSCEFNKNYFPDLANKIHYNIFETSSDFLNNNKNFDVILISQSFRHMKDPFRTLSILYEILNDDGYIVIDESLLLDTILREYFEGKKNEQFLSSIFTHGKAFYYSQNHIKYLFESSGFEFIKYEKYNSPDIEYIELDLMLFKKTQNIFKGHYDDYQCDDSHNFDSIKDVYFEDQNQFNRFFIEY